MRRIPVVLAALALLATACQADDTSTTTLDDGADAVEVTPDQGESPTAAPDSTATSNGDSDGPADGSAGDVIDVRSQHPVTAGPGRWAIGDAGFVEFDLADGLVLADVTESDGWSSRVDEESPDEIEVDFRRDNVDIEVEIEWDDGTLEIDIDTDIEPAETGVYELGQAGSVEYALDDGRLTLRDVVVSDGWNLRIDEESADEIEFSLQSGNERWRVEIELDDGVIELEIDYRVRDAA